jgi:hypothetical protein
MPEKTKPALRRVTDGLLPHEFRGRSHQPLRAVSGDSIPIATNDSVACGSGQRTTGTLASAGRVMSLIGTTRTFRNVRYSVAVGCKADFDRIGDCPVCEARRFAKAAAQ